MKGSFAMQKLVITFDEAVTEKYLKLAGQKTEAEVNAECCPCGVSLLIDLGGPWGNSASIRMGNNIIELGDITVDLVNT